MSGQPCGTGAEHVTARLPPARDHRADSAVPRHHAHHANPRRESDARDHYQAPARHVSPGVHPEQA
ncbi:hypothetical protein, partial [Streptomyces sp. NPDC007883]|uniref:hypothetical protein n=1 Tax=Streptomyces sp. NPDC007883 TaxID=3155116 RepID=UPI0033CB9135